MQMYVYNVGSAVFLIRGFRAILFLCEEACSAHVHIGSL